MNLNHLFVIALGALAAMVAVIAVYCYRLLREDDRAAGPAFVPRHAMNVRGPAPLTPVAATPPSPPVAGTAFRATDPVRDGGYEPAGRAQAFVDTAWDRSLAAQLRGILDEEQVTELAGGCDSTGVLVDRLFSQVNVPLIFARAGVRRVA